MCCWELPPPLHGCLVGAVAQMVAHGLILAILFHLSASNQSWYPRLGCPQWFDESRARFAADQCSPGFGGMASAGIPGMAGFVAEILVLQGFSVFPLPTLVCVVCTGLTAVYFIILLNRTCFGKLDNNTAYYPQVQLSDAFQL